MPILGKFLRFFWLGGLPYCPPYCDKQLLLSCYGTEMSIKTENYIFGGILGKILPILGKFLSFFFAGGFHIDPHIGINKFCFHDMAQKWLSMLLPSTSYLPYSGSYRLLKESKGNPKLKNSTFPHSHLPIPRPRACVINCGSTF